MAIILVVDDEPSIRALCRLILESAGHGVREADGEAAVACCRREAPDLVLCDILMPQQGDLGAVVDLRRTMRRLRQEFAGVPVVAMSGGMTDGQSFLRAARGFGAVAALTKPFKPNQLLELVGEALDGRPAGQSA